MTNTDERSVGFNRMDVPDAKQNNFFMQFDNGFTVSISDLAQPANPDIRNLEVAQIDPDGNFVSVTSFCNNDPQKIATIIEFTREGKVIPKDFFEAVEQLLAEMKKNERN